MTRRSQAILPAAAQPGPCADMSKGVVARGPFLPWGEDPPRDDVLILIGLGYTDVQLGAHYGRSQRWAYKMRRRQNIAGVPKRVTGSMRQHTNPMPAERAHEPFARLPTAEQTAAWHKGYRFDQGRVG